MIVAGLVFDLSDQIHALAADLGKIVVHVDQVLLAGNEGAGNKVHAVLDAERDIRLILIRQVLLLHDLAGEAHALAVGKLAAANHAAMNILALDLLYAEGQKAVIEQNGITGNKLMHKLCIADRHDAFVSLHLVCRKGKALTLDQGHATVFKGLDTVLGTLGVQHDGNGHIQLGSYLLDAVNSFLMILVGIMGKIQSGYVHARLAKSAQGIFALSGRSYGTNNFCFAHISLQIIFCVYYTTRKESMQ